MRLLAKAQSIWIVLEVLELTSTVAAATLGQVLERKCGPHSPALLLQTTGHGIVPHARLCQQGMADLIKEHSAGLQLKAPCTVHIMDNVYCLSHVDLRAVPAVLSAPW